MVTEYGVTFEGEIFFFFFFCDALFFHSLTFVACLVAKHLYMTSDLRWCRTRRSHAGGRSSKVVSLHNVDDPEAGKGLLFISTVVLGSACLQLIVLGPGVLLFPLGLAWLVVVAL